MNINTIDADGHIVEKDADIRKYLQEPFNKRGGRLLPSDGLDTNLGGLVGGLEEVDIPTRLTDMTKENIDVAVLFPTSSFAVNGFMEKEYAVAYARAYNDYAAEVCKHSPRLKAVGLVALQDPEAAVAEANRAITKLGLCSIAVATQGTKEHLGSKTFWPLYEEMQRLNVPLSVHNRRETPAGDKRFDSFIFMHTIGRPVETVIQFAGLMYAGVPEKFPKLRISFLECGVGWAPYWIERMDEEWEKRGKVETPLCKHKPSEYIAQGNWFFAFEPEEKTLPFAIEHVGDDKIIFASDYPHWDGMFPYVTKTIRERKDISEQAKNRILGENAKRLYGWN